MAHQLPVHISAPLEGIRQEKANSLPYESISTSPHTAETLQRLCEENHRLREQLCELQANRSSRAADYRYLKASQEVADHYEHKVIVDLARDVRMHRCWRRRLDDAEVAFKSMIEGWQQEKDTFSHKLTQVQADKEALEKEYIRKLEQIVAHHGAATTPSCEGESHSEGEDRAHTTSTLSLAAAGSLDPKARLGFMSAGHVQRGAQAIWH